MLNLKSLSKLSLALALAIPVALATLGTPVLMEAQAISGDILGVVMDSSGAVVPNVQVVATNIGTGVKTTTVTNGSGEYHFINLPVGHYGLAVNGNGMSGGYKDVEVLLNKRSTANITAAVAAASTSIEVSTEALTIDTTTPQIQNTFENQQVQDIPTATVGLGVLNLALLNAGVATSGGIGAGTGPSVSGQRPRNNNFTIEGVDNNSKSVTGPVVTIPNDAVQNFTVLQNQFNPEYGHSSGGQFNQTIVSGTNQWHGRAYEYFQNRNLNAIDASNARTQAPGPFSNPAFDSNRFGGQIGGPIWKDKVFFFTNQEYNPVHQALGTLFICAPTALGYTQLNALPGLSQTNLGVLKAAEGTAPASGGPNCTAIGATTTGGSIGADLGEIDFAPSIFNNTYTSTNSVDVNLSEKDQIRGRYIYQKNDSTDASSNIPTFFTTVPVRNQLLTLSEYHTFAPTLTNEFRLGFNRNTQFFTAGNFTFPGVPQFPNLSFDDTLNQIGPDPNAPQFGIQNVYQATDNVDWIKGKHNFKLGFEARDYISPQGFTQRARGDYEYANTEEFLQDLSPSSFGQRSTGNNTYYGNQLAYYAYGNDEFRLTKNLTLNFGIRYEYTGVPFTEQLQSLNSAASVPGLINFGAPQAPKNNWAPRVGFAYSPGSAADTTIRGGYAMSYDVLYDNLGLLAVPPQFGGTCDVLQSVNGAGGCSWNDNAFLANGGLPLGQGAGLKTFTDLATQRAATANFIPDNVKYPYSETWTLGVEHVFAKKYTAEVRYVGTRGIHLPVQQQLNVQPKVSSSLFLPTFLTPPDPGTVAGLTTTLAQINAQPRIIPAFSNAGFVNGITSFQPLGQSKYDGLQTQLTRTFSNGLQFLGAYTWSHAFDNSTADVFSTVLTPRRPQNSQDFAADYSTSALDRRHRLSLSAIYDMPFLKNSSNWLAKNILGNWEIAPVWQLQSGEPFTPQSGVDSNLNGDSAPDRTVFNPNGIPGTGADVIPVCKVPLGPNNSCSAGNTVGYQIDPLAPVQNPQYVQAGKGALSNITRNTLLAPRTNNWDLTVVKSIKMTEKTTFQFAANAFNVFNHSQFIPGSPNQVNSIGLTGVTAFVRANNAAFNDPSQAFSNNARTMQLVAKFIF